LKLAERWIAERRNLWERRLDRLGELVAEDEIPKPSSPRKKRRKP
jgi:hypothetical protein